MISNYLFVTYIINLLYLTLNTKLLIYKKIFFFKVSLILMRKNKLYNCLPEVNVIQIIVLRYQNNYSARDTFYDKRDFKQSHFPHREQ